ncbi:MAG: ABC transporter permease [Gemmatimonadaceae bacterium]
MIDTLTRDLRYALRALVHSPGFTTIAILSLALGIGVNSAIFTLVNATTFPDLPYRDAGRLVDVHETSSELCAGCSVGTSFPTFRDWRERATSFSGIGAYSESGVALLAGEEPERVSGAYVSAQLFPTLGVAPVIGRGILPEEDRAGAARVALIGHGLWTRVFGGDSSAVGRTVRVNGEPTAVIGVMPAGFEFPEFADVWLPITPFADTLPRSERAIGVVARLKDGVPLRAAQEEIGRLTSGIAQQDPEALRNWSGAVVTLRDDLTADSGPPFLILLGASGLVLLIACANLANLMLVRANRRVREMAVRSAVGATTNRLVRQLLTESLLLAGIGAALGMLIAVWSVDIARQFMPGEVPFWIQFEIDWRVVAFTVGLATLTGVGVGLVPALRTAGVQVHDVLKDAGRGATIGRRQSWLRSALVVAEVALSLVLLAGAGLLIKALARGSDTRDLGYDPNGVLQASAEFVGQRYRQDEQLALTTAELLERLTASGGVERVALSYTQFLGTFVGSDSRLTLEGSSSAVPDAVVPRFAHVVTPGYFEMLRIPVQRGRGILESDGVGAPGVLVVNEAAAASLWPNQDPLGKLVKLGAPNEQKPWLTVVGVVRNTMGNPMSTRAAPFVYLSFAQQPGRSITIHARTRGDPAAFAPTLRRIAAGIDRDMPLTDVVPTVEQLATWMSPIRFMMRLLVVLAVLALVLAAMGIYGVLSYIVSQRAHEIGIRVALGAGGRRVVHLVVRQGVALAVLGVAVGLLGAFAATRVLRAFLFGANAMDPLVLAAVAGTLLVVALIACVIPVRRALRVDPVDALRVE